MNRRKSRDRTHRGEFAHSDFPNSSNVETQPPLMIIRRGIVRMLSRATLQKTADSYARYVPKSIQRGTERLVDFPISSEIRKAPVLLIRIPRCASTSLAHGIYGHEYRIPHRTALFYRNSDPEYFNSTVSFGVVRNPWDRLVSAYFHLKGDKNGVSHANFHSRKMIGKFNSFEHFLKDYLAPRATKLAELDPVLHSQSSYVCDADGKIIVSKIFNFEKLNQLQEFLTSKNLSENIEHRNISERHINSLKMSREVVNIIADIYREDISRFCYSFHEHYR